MVQYIKYYAYNNSLYTLLALLFIVLFIAYQNTCSCKGSATAERWLPPPALHQHQETPQPPLLAVVVVVTRSLLKLRIKRRVPRVERGLSVSMAAVVTGKTPPTSTSMLILVGIQITVHRTHVVYRSIYLCVRSLGCTCPALKHDIKFTVSREPVPVPKYNA